MNTALKLWLDLVLRSLGSFCDFRGFGAGVSRCQPSPFEPRDLKFCRCSRFAVRRLTFEDSDLTFDFPPPDTISKPVDSVAQIRADFEK